MKNKTLFQLIEELETLKWPIEDSEELANLIQQLKLNFNKTTVIYEQLFERISLGFALCELILDKQGKPEDYRFLRINSAFEKQTELKINNAIGKTVREIYPDIEQSWIDKYGSVVINNKPIQFIDFNHNTNKYYSVNAFSLSENNFAMIFEDITQKKKAEEKLKESENKLREFIDSAADGFMLFDSKLNQIQINEVALKITNQKRKDVIGKNILDLVPYVKTSGRYAQYKKVIQTGKPFIVEDLIPHPKFGNKIVILKAFKADGGLGIIISDITGKKKTKAALDESDKQYNLLFDSMNEMVAIIELIYDKDGQPIDYYIREINPSFAKFLGKTRGQLLNKRITSIIYTIEDYWLKSFASVEKTGETISFQNYGAEYDKYYNVVAWKIAKKRVGISFIDITAIKQTEIELKKAKEQAEESNKLKSAFLANMSHEIRTPMNAILGCADLLDDETLEIEDKKACLAHINTSGKRLLTIINDIVDISKIDANQQKLIYIDYNLNKLIDDLYEQFNIINKNPAIELKKEQAFTDANSYIKTDEVRLIQILSNLIENALKHTSKGEVLFGYDLHKEFLQFYVKDTGTGIKKEDLTLIFERFGQVKNGKTRITTGTGLGISISKGLVDLFEGKIWVDSELGKGTNFYFTIPYIPGNKAEKNKTTILVAEDEGANFFLIQNWLKDMYSVIRAKNGIEAIELFKEHPNLELILMDIKMPFMDGIEATIKIRKKNKNVPIIACTAYVMNEESVLIKKAGCNDILTKPVEKEVLLSTITKYINKNKGV